MTTLNYPKIIEKFLSTPSARRATGMPLGVEPSQQISIHALREEGDPTMPVTPPPLESFLSTPSARRATHVVGGLAFCDEISIHALREEGDTHGCECG